MPSPTLPPDNLPPAPGTGFTGSPAAMHVRVRHGMKRPENWMQLVRFIVVGASGFIANIGVYALSVHALGVDYRVAALLGFMAGVCNNFFWHRIWTFGARDGHAGSQAVRFFVVYGVTFLIGVGVLQALVNAGLARVLGQAISQIVITPLNFLGHKLWSFD
ncbi:MAG: GtrA family protein [Solirubrobacteraceae bacterium]|nr:GtrA family protein [Patulibacter sp.]